MGAGNYVHRLLGTMIGLCGDELLWKVHKIHLLEKPYSMGCWFDAAQRPRSQSKPRRTTPSWREQPKCRSRSFKTATWCQWW